MAKQSFEAHRRAIRTASAVASSNRVCALPRGFRDVEDSSQWLVSLRAAQLNLAKVTLRNLDRMGRSEEGY